MPLTLLLRLVLACCTLLPLAAAAAAPATLHEQADRMGLPADPYWHLLLRYSPARTPGGVESEAESAFFFVSPEGRHDAAAELHALLEALFAGQREPGKDAAACRFPARTAWLEGRLGFRAPPADCPLFQEWKAAIRPAQATLVFAADYLNSPSSMFGHTFLRLDAPEQTEDTRLLAYAVNFAAVTSNYSAMSFAWNGLTGGYPGVFSLLPYYDKVKEYSDMENRDLWEYQLAFTPAELQRLLDHLWELRGVEFPYYFLTRNCSFQLLALFEVARPGLDLRSAFPLQAIPADTARRVWSEPGLARKLTYRPSAERRLLQDARDNGSAVNAAARKLSRDPAATVSLAPADEASALEAAYDLRYYRFLSDGQEAGARAGLRQLLLRRAALDVPTGREPPPQPAVDPTGGHATARIALAAGTARDAAYLALRLRPAYHDLLDSPAGYRRGAHIDFLDGELRLDDSRQHLRLERLAIVDIDSLATWDDFFKPLSWFVGFGYRQAAVDGAGRFSPDRSHGVAYVDGGAGAGTGGDLAECHLFLAASAEGGQALDDGWRAGAGPRGSCQLYLHRGRLRMQADSRFFSDIEAFETRLSLEGQIDLSPSNGLRLQVGELRAGSTRQGFGEAAWIHYF